MPLSRINSASIANSAISAADIADGTITAAKIISVANTQITGTLSVANTSITGNIASSQIAPNQVFYGNVDIGLALTSNNTNTLSVGGDIELQKTVTADGDSLGQVVFWNNTNAGVASGTSFVNDVARIKGVMDGTGNNSGGRLEFYTKADAASSQKVMDMDGAGRITMPYQSSFLAAANFAVVTYAAGAKIIFDTIGHNTGNNFNTTTGRFTAPVTGVYLFSISMWVQAASNPQIILRVNNAEQRFATDVTLLASSGASGNQGYAVIIKLTANDYVEPFTRIDSAGGDLYGRHSHFSGHLLG
jgi:hypothetical protein